MSQPDDYRPREAVICWLISVAITMALIWTLLQAIDKVYCNQHVPEQVDIKALKSEAKYRAVQSIKKGAKND